ncbi:MAG: high-affinity branched-chain amino acid ABC transporter permease LivM [Sedimenticola sp.]|nr:high-affinity branched-chain amino acid ABC transporter permease LivM [Sedimenticola sp.]
MMNQSNNNTTGIDFKALLKESGIAALVALGLAIVLVGFKTVDTPTGMDIATRWVWVLVAVASVFVGRMLFAIRRERRASRAPVQVDLKLKERKAAIIVNRFSTIGGPLFIGFALVLPFMPFADRYVVDVATYVLIYVMLGWGLNIVVGLAGLLDLGYVAFYAVGAYSYALFAAYFDLSFWVCLPLAGLCAASFGVLLGFPVLRLRGDYLAIVTLGFGEIIRVILLNWYDFTGGPDGISGIPRPSFFGLELKRTAAEGEQTFHQFFNLDYSTMHRLIFLYYLILMLALLTNFFTLRIRKMPIGRAWEALREDEIACRSLGINPTNTKLTAFALGAMFAGFAGSFFATRQAFISPESFTFIESAVILAIVVLGGMGSQVGVAIAAVLLIGGTELFRGLEEFRMLAFGGLMVAVMVWKPRGLLAHREPTVKLHPDGATPTMKEAAAEGGAK